MTDSRIVNACARNNANWCDSVLISAGATTRFQTGFWCAEGKQLPLFPNLVTLSPKANPELTAALKALPLDATVKDSFGTLNLAPLGFKKLLSGTWLFRPPVAKRKPPVPSNWHKITNQEGLRSWVAAWNADESVRGLFPPKLLLDPSVRFASVSADGTGLKAGAVINDGPALGGQEIAGISNVFSRKSWLFSALHDLLAPFSHRPVCTYETDSGHLPVYRQLDFQECGSLNIWQKYQYDA